MVVSDADDIEGVYAAIGMVGALMGKEAEAAAVTDSMKQMLADVSEKATGDGSVTVCFEVSPLQYGLGTADSGMSSAPLTEWVDGWMAQFSSG